MRIAVLSDTHAYLDERFLKYFEGCDEIWHAGDIGDLAVTDKLEQITKVRAVYGNIDNHLIRASFPENARFSIDGLKIWITHIGGFPGRYDFRIREEMYQNPPDVFICGHSHILKVQFDKKLRCMCMNPGAAGAYGFHKNQTALRFEIKAGKLENLEVIDLGAKRFP